MTCREAVLIMTVLGLVGVVHTNAYSDEKLAEAEKNEVLVKHYAGLVAGCMNGDNLVWTDPHSKMDMLAECRIHEAGIIK